MARSTSKDTQALFQSLRSAYAATPTNLKVSLSLSLSGRPCVRKSASRSNLSRFIADHRSLRDVCDFHSVDSGILVFSLYRH
uniref:Uncharacterized protein n=1 Tax=Nelumbo nucifera TaxID=4432 RepID=A0A822YVM9_NELNU|nr:TPA_asm: hypothetical protein HUJ06_007211 [Nelumbo nucifera]